MLASALPSLAAALRSARSTAPAALLCLALASLPARSEQQKPAHVLVPLGEGAHGVLSLPMHLDTTGFPGVVVVHDLDGRSAEAGLHVETLLALGIPVLEIEPFPRVTNGVVALPNVSDLDAATLVTAAAEALAIAEGIDPRAIGALGFGAGARAVLLAGPGANGRAPLSARVLLYPGCETPRRPFFVRIMAAPARQAPGTQGGTLALPNAAPEGHMLLLHGGRDPGNTEASCAALANDLALVAKVDHAVMPEAGYGSHGGARAALARPGARSASGMVDGGSLSAPATDTTDGAADVVSVFLVEALRTTPLRAAAR